MPNTRDFTPDELDEMDVNPWNCVATWVVDERRWSIDKAVVFEHEGSFWQVIYSDPATEMQEGQDVWDDQSTVTATQVEKHEVTVERWMPVA